VILHSLADDLGNGLREGVGVVPVSAASEVDLVGVGADVGSIMAAILGAVAAAGTIRAAWRRTVGRRRDLRRRLARLGVGYQVTFFEAVLGGPPAMREAAWLDLPSPTVSRAHRLREWAHATVAEVRHGQWRDPESWTMAWLTARSRADDQAEQRLAAESVAEVLLWPLPECWVQAYVDAAGVVSGFAVTQRDPRLRARLRFPPREAERKRWWRRRLADTFFDVTLGKTVLSDVVQRGKERDQALVASVRNHAARSWYFADLYSFGASGHYLCFVAAANYSGNPSRVGDVSSFFADESIDSSPAVWATSETARKFRSSTVATTFAVMSSQLAAERTIWDVHRDTVGPLLGAAR
jgi:hypothetical protein